MLFFLLDPKRLGITFLLFLPAVERPRGNGFAVWIRGGLREDSLVLSTKRAAVNFSLIISKKEEATNSLDNRFAVFFGQDPKGLGITFLLFFRFWKVLGITDLLFPGLVSNV